MTGLQLTALFLFEYKRAAAFCYLPILFVRTCIGVVWQRLTSLQLPKIYTLTLILSLTLPQNHQPGHTPSHVFSLPNLESCPNEGNANTSPYSTGIYHRHTNTNPNTTPVPVLPPLQLTLSKQAKDRDKDKRKSTKSNLSSAVARSWRLSQDWLSWSLISNGNEERSKERERDEVLAAKWKIPDHGDQVRPLASERCHLPLGGRADE